MLLGTQPSSLIRPQTLVLTDQGPLSARGCWVFFREFASAGPPESESSLTHSGLCPCASSSGTPVIGLSLLTTLHPFPTLLLPRHPSFLELLPVERGFFHRVVRNALPGITHGRLKWCGKTYRDRKRRLPQVSDVPSVVP